MLIAARRGNIIIAGVILIHIVCITTVIAIAIAIVSMKVVIFDFTSGR